VGGATPRTPPPVKKRLWSDAAAEFLTMWQAYGTGVHLEREVRCCTERRFRFDLAHTPSRTAVEVHGGAWAGGRHVRGSGFARDCEKRVHAATHDWMLLEFTTHQLRADPHGCFDAVLCVIRRRMRPTGPQEER